MTHESKVSLETLRFCRELVREKRTEAKLELDYWAPKPHRRAWERQIVAHAARLAELDAEIAEREGSQ